VVGGNGLGRCNLEDLIGGGVVWIFKVIKLIYVIINRS
jgi:hypothetical protein